MVEVILKQEIRQLGTKGDIVRVANGYARNYLFPKQLAMPATSANKQQIGQMRAAADREAARLKGDAEKLAEILTGLTIKITARAGESDQLFGSVTSRDIAAALEELGYSVERQKIVVKKPIRMVGEHEVVIHLHRDIDVPLKVIVLAEGREEEPVQEAAPAEESEEVEPQAEASSEEPADQEPKSRKSEPEPAEQE